MPHQKRHLDWVYQVIDEPGPGSFAVGYVRSSSELHDSMSITTQKQRITEFATRKQWKIVRWYEESVQSAGYEDVEQRPVFAQLLRDAEAGQFQVGLCYANNRWSRNTTLTMVSLSRLRKAHVWWATADGLWDLGKTQQDGIEMGFLIDTQMNEVYIRQLSRRTIDGKEDRAREGYHNGYVPFGYAPPEYPKAPDGAPSTWRPPRIPVRPDPITFPALVRIGELAAQGWSDRAIANELEEYNSRTPRFGERALTKDTIAAIRRSWFPREFAPGCGHGTIDTPTGELVEGRHEAAWPYELWQRMVEVKASQYRRPTREAQRHPHEFSRIIVCAACRRPLRVTFGNVNRNFLPYYRDTSVERKLPCPVAEAGFYSVRSSLVVTQFGDLLKSVELPIAWREAIAEQCRATNKVDDSDSGRILRRRAELEEEHKRLVNVYTKGYITERELDEKVERIRSELFELPIPEVRDPEKATQEAISAGETLGRMQTIGMRLPPEERRDMVWSLLNVEGLIYDLERHIIVVLKPRAAVLAVLALGLEATSMWEQRGESLWLRDEYLPPQLEKENPRLPSQPPALTLAQQERAIMLIRQGISLRKVADLLETSHESIRRFVKSQGMVLQPSVQKLAPEELEEAYALLRADVPFREVAQRFGISDASLWRLAERDGVVLRPKGQKLTPTQRRLTPEEQQEACDLVKAGVSLRQTAKQFGISRNALERILQGGESGEK